MVEPPPGHPSGLAAPGTAPRYSVVIPVYNEGENVAPLCRRLLETLVPGYEVLFVYDSEEDDTLPRLRELAPEARPSPLRLLRNEKGGVRNAIDLGLRSAGGAVVVVAMADLADDWEKLPEMVERAERGAAVVCASRYVKGGGQHGGPLLKKTLSRMAGLSLHARGLPTHDPTNSFKAYRKDFLDAIVIESEAGFSLALELTVKAYLSGRRVEEVPAQWWDRSAGASRFRLFRWLPEYWRWYWLALRSRPRRVLP